MGWFCVLIFYHNMLKCTKLTKNSIYLRFLFVSPFNLSAYNIHSIPEQTEDVMKVYLEERVLMSIITAAAEVYKLECYGCLLGYKSQDAIIVDNAIPYQSAERSFSTVELKEKQRNIIEKVLRTFPKLDVIGEFHSHPQHGDVKGDVVLSGSDMRNVSNSDLELVVAINDKKQTRKWRYNGDLTISGTFANYHIKIAAYKYSNNNGCHRPKRIHLWCPVAMGLGNRRQKKAS